MKTIINKIPDIASYFFILLFCYAALSKMMDFENFQVQIAQSPLLSAYAGLISYFIIIVELVIVTVLIFPTIRSLGLYASLGIMTAFTLYIFLILHYSEFIPCSCGGILEKMGWTEHLIFNIITVLMAIFAIICIEKQSKKNCIFYRSMIIGVMAMNSAVVIYLFFSSEHIIKKENNFTRRFLMHPILEQKSFKLSDSYYYFAGKDKQSIYLGNRKLPQNLLKIDTAFSNPITARVNLDNFRYPFRNLQMQVKAPYYYIYDGTVPIIFRGQLGSLKAQTISLNDAYFNQLIVLDSGRFAIRTQSSETKEFLLADLEVNQKEKKLRLYPDILQKQMDGVFDVDGNLIVNGNNSQLIYTYTYRNQFIVMDSKLAVQHKMKTIDTVKQAQIKTIGLSDGTHKMSAPPLKVNLRSAVNQNLIFNQSGLMGRHESKKAWRKANVIDVYQTDEPTYIGSFYIFKKDNQNISDFIVTDQYLYVIMNDELIQYKFTKPIGKYFTSGVAENRSKE